MSDQVGVALIGCGYWGMNYVRVFSELEQSRVAVVCDQREERLEEVARRFPGVAVTTDLGEALRMDGVRAAVVATPASTHHQVTRECLEAGKHILVEKPITTTSIEAEDLIRVAELNELTLMVGHTFLYNPAIWTVKEHMDQGELGRVYYMYARRTNLGPIRRDVNALWDLAPHDVSIFNYLLGRLPSWVSAVGARVLRNGHEDVGFVSLGYESDLVAHIHVSWTDAYKVREIVVVGSDKRVVFNDYNPMERVRVFEKGVAVVEPEGGNIGEYHLRMRDGVMYSPRVEVSEPLKNQGAHFIDCVRTGRRPLSDGRDGLKVVQVMEAIDRSIALKGAPVELGQENGYVYEGLNGHYSVR